MKNLQPLSRVFWRTSEVLYSVTVLDFEQMSEKRSLLSQTFQIESCLKVRDFQESATGSAGAQSTTHTEHNDT